MRYWKPEAVPNWAAGMARRVFITTSSSVKAITELLHDFEQSQQKEPLIASGNWEAGVCFAQILSSDGRLYYVTERDMWGRWVLRNWPSPSIWFGQEWTLDLRKVYQTVPYAGKKRCGSCVASGCNSDGLPRTRRNHRSSHMENAQISESPRASSMSAILNVSDFLTDTPMVCSWFYLFPEVISWLIITCVIYKGWEMKRYFNF